MLFKFNDIKRRGFTLIELLVVVAIIGILSSVVLASLNTAREKAKLTKTIAGIKQLGVALELYRNDTGSYPAPTSYNATGDNGGYNYDGVFDPLLIGKYLSELPHAPSWPNNHCGNASACDLITYTIANPASDFANFGLNYYCGRKLVDNYILSFYSGGRAMDDFPKFEVSEDQGQTFYGTFFGTYIIQDRNYCISFS